MVHNKSFISPSLCSLFNQPLSVSAPIIDSRLKYCCSQQHPFETPVTSSPFTYLPFFFSVPLGLWLSAHLPHLSAVFFFFFILLSALDFVDGVRQEQRDTGADWNRHRGSLSLRDIKRCEEFKIHPFFSPQKNRYLKLLQTLTIGRKTQGWTDVQGLSAKRA